MRLPRIPFSPRTRTMQAVQLLAGTTAAVLTAGVLVSVVSAVPATAAPAATPGPATELTQQQALAQARQTRKPVPVTGATTPTSTLTANPSGTLTLTASAVPVRKRVGGQWQKLDPTLRLLADGTVAPAVTTSSVVLSGGGSGPLATLDNTGRRLALQAPMTLPKPTLSGVTATYANVLPGVDLQATVDAQGAFSEVFVLHTADAVAALRTVKLGTQGTGVTVRADAAGNLAAVDGHGQAAFTAVAPMMWDSAAPKTAGKADQQQSDVDATTHRRLRSSHAGAGADARTARLGVAVGASDVTLTPDAAMLAAPDLVYPLYYDPTWTPANVSKSAWATVTKKFPGSSYYNNTPDPTGHMQVGNSGSGGIWSHTLINFGIPAVLNGATINTAQLSLTEVYSFSCIPSEVAVYAPAATLTSGNATWNAWSSVSLGTKVDGQVAAHGYNSGCPAAPVGFNVLSAVNSAVAAHKATQTFVLTAINESTDTNGYKEFDAGTPQLSIEYNHAPTPPAGLTTSPTTDCTAATPTAVGDGDVSLVAPVYDQNGGNLGVQFQLWKTSAPGSILAFSDPNVLTAASGTKAVLVVTENTLKTAAGSTATRFSWRVQTNDTVVNSGWSATCSFTFDPTRPGSPVLTLNGSPQIAQPTTVTIAADPGSSTPSTYTYQLNGQAPSTVTASGGNATITVTPNRFTNTLAVTAASAGGNFGDTATLTFNAAAAATQADHDLDGDGTADLVVTGTGLPAGLWLARGTSGNAVNPNASDIGVNGTGIGATGPAAYNGSQIITGHFTGSGLQDVFVYYPTGASAGNGAIINGNGDGSALEPAYTASVVNDITDTAGGRPSQLVNAGNAAGHNLAIPDLLGVTGDGSSLNYYPNSDFIGGYINTYPLTTLTPTGGTDWGNWTLATSQTASGATNMFLRKASTGALYLWTNVTADLDAGTLSYVAHTVAASGWNTGAALNLQAQDVNLDGVTDLRVVAGTTVTTYLTSNVTGSAATLTGWAPQTLTTASHQWMLNDLTSSTAADSVGTLTVTATPGVTRNSGDLFSPDVKLDGINGTLTTAAGSPAVATNADFTVSAWVKPSSVGGVVLSQDGNQTSGFKLWADNLTSTWRFGLAGSDTAGATFDTAIGAAGGVRTGVWTELTATYRQSGGILNLYVNGVNVATATHTTTWNATGRFRIGAAATQGTANQFSTGQVANVRTWNRVVDPAQSATPAGYYQAIPPTRFLDTRNGAGTPIPASSTIKLPIAGVSYGTGTVPASGVTAVAVNATVVLPTSFGFVTLFPSNTPQPVTSNINFLANAVVANFAIVPVGPDGSISIYNAAGGTTHILIDVAGYFTSDAAKAGNSTFQPLNPTRLLDTRTGLGTPTGAVTAGNTITLQVGGVSGIPANATTVAINLTSANATANGFLVTRADGTTPPAVSGLQFSPGTVLADLALVNVGANGKTAIAVQGPTGSHTDVIGDVVGYFTGGTSGKKYHTVNATRLLDTRQNNTPLPQNQARPISQGNNVIAADPILILNIVATQQATAGFAIAYADGTAPPAVSNLNWNANQTVANLALPKTAGGTVDIYNAGGGSIHMIVDCLGYFAST